MSTANSIITDNPSLVTNNRRQILKMLAALMALAFVAGPEESQAEAKPRPTRRGKPATREEPVSTFWKSDETIRETHELRFLILQYTHYRPTAADLGDRGLDKYTQNFRDFLRLAADRLDAVDVRMVSEIAMAFERVPRDPGLIEWSEETQRRDLAPYLKRRGGAA